MRQKLLKYFFIGAAVCSTAFALADSSTSSMEKASFAGIVYTPTGKSIKAAIINSDTVMANDTDVKTLKNLGVRVYSKSTNPKVVIANATDKLVIVPVKHTTGQVETVALVIPLKSIPGLLAQQTVSDSFWSTIGSVLGSAWSQLSGSAYCSSLSLSGQLENLDCA